MSGKCRQVHTVPAINTLPGRGAFVTPVPRVLCAVGLGRAQGPAPTVTEHAEPVLACSAPGCWLTGHLRAHASAGTQQPPWMVLAVLDRGFVLPVPLLSRRAGCFAQSGFLFSSSFCTFILMGTGGLGLPTAHLELMVPTNT